MDLPCDDSAATFETYADVVVRALEVAAREEAVLVGHSLAGLTIPLVAASRPLSRLIFLCAIPPIPGRSFVEQIQIEEEMLQPAYLSGLGQPDAEGRRAWVDEAVARRVFYADCDEMAAHNAFERLRPQAQSPYVQPCALESIPPIPCTYVVCGEDRIVNPVWSRRVAGEWLNADLVELPGGHSPFLSRPADLANLLHQAVQSA